MEETLEGLREDNRSLAEEMMTVKAILGAIEDAFEGNEPSALMKSFPIVAKAWRMKQVRPTFR